MSVRLIIGDQERAFDALEWTHNDPGGCETLTSQITAGTPPNPGDRAVVFVDGPDPVWDGIVEEPGQRHARGRQAANVTAVGHGAALKRDPYSMVYQDRDVGNWVGPGAARRLALASSYRVTGASSQPTDASGPSLMLGPIQLNGGAKPLSEAWYDAGPGNTIAEFRYTWQGTSLGVASSDAAWQAFIGTQLDLAGSLQELSTNLLATSQSGSAVFRPATMRRFAYALLYYDSTAVASADVDRFLQLTDLRAVGPHGLPLYGTGLTEGVAVTDVALHALQQARAGFTAEVAEDSLVLPHLVYRDPTTPDTVISDMAKLLAWHWGVWPGSCLDPTPRFVLAPPPTEATAAVRYQDVEDLDLTEKLSTMYDAAEVTYTDGETGGRLTITKRHPRLPDGVSQTLILDVGQAGADAAEKMADLALVSSQLQSRAAGSGTLPAMILDAAGKPRPAHTLQPGRDRLLIPGLPYPSSSAMLADSEQRIEAFRIRRLTTRIQNGKPSTSVEFDTGADLIETLQARVAAFTGYLGG